MRNFIAFFFICYSPLCFSQEQKLISLDSIWKKEIFHFPISFAKTIPYKGFEEARFPPKGWLDEKHPNFWSYTFAWKIETKERVRTEELERNLSLYFDGLNRNKEHKTIASIKKVKEYNSTLYLKGSLLIFDRFVTQKKLQLNVLIENRFCENLNESLILFKFSPKNFNHKTWNLLKKIKLEKDSCK